MKSYKIAIILVVILGILACAYLIVKSNKEDAGTAANDIKLINVDKGVMNEIDINTKDVNFVFKKVNGAWTMSSPNYFEVDPTKIETIAENLSSLTALRIIDDNAKDLAKYGLDRPVVVTVKTAGSEKITLYVGDKNAVGDSNYVKLGDNKIYTISSVIGKNLNVQINDIRKLKLFSMTSDEITGYTLEKGGKVQYKMVKTANKVWKITEPIATVADSSISGEMMDKILSLGLSQIVEDNPQDLSKYGLDNPSYSIELTSASKKVKLLLGKEDTEFARIYAKLSDGKEVYTMSQGNLDFIDKSLKDVMDPFVYIAKITEVSNFKLDMDGYKIDANLKCGDDTTKDKISVNGKDVSQVKYNQYPLFRKLYEEISNLPTDDLDLNAKPSGTADITINYTDKNGTTKVEFIPRDNEYYYAVVNGKYTGNLIFKKQLDKADGVRATLKKLMDAVK